jgi:hypothetical protein
VTFVSTLRIAARSVPPLVQSESVFALCSVARLPLTAGRLSRLELGAEKGMRPITVSEALTGAHHYEQAAFTALLK